MSIWRQLWECARAVPFVIPEMLAERLSLVVTSFHEPIDGYCVRCHVEAPCKPFMEAAETVHDSRLAIAGYWDARS